MITAFYTCNRIQPYIGQTLDSFFEWFPDKSNVYVSEEPDTPAYLNRTKVKRILQTEKLGCVKHWLEMAKYLVLQTFDELYMLCEDDIQFIKRPILPDGFNGVASAYCSQVNIPIEKGWHKPYIGKTGWCGSLCLFFSRGYLELITNNENKILELSEGKHLDYAIGKFFTDIMIVHYPTLVLHTGEVSTYPNNNKVENATNRCRQPAL